MLLCQTQDFYRLIRTQCSMRTTYRIPTRSRAREQRLKRRGHVPARSTTGSAQRGSFSRRGPFRGRAVQDRQGARSPRGSLSCSRTASAHSSMMRNAASMGRGSTRPQHAGSHASDPMAGLAGMAGMAGMEVALPAQPAHQTLLGSIAARTQARTLQIRWRVWRVWRVWRWRCPHSPHIRRC